MNSTELTTPFRRLTGVLLLVGLALPSPGEALTGFNHCGPGTSPPTGMSCRQNQLLLGYRDAAGACVWVCCPPNRDGKTYDCSAPPTPSDYRMDLRHVTAEEWKGQFSPDPPAEKKDPEDGTIETMPANGLEHPIVPDLPHRIYPPR